MDLYSNHCFCTKSRWGGMYSCKYMVNIEQYPNEDSSQKQNSEWKKLLNIVDFFDTEEFEKKKAQYPEKEEDFIRMICEKQGPRLKPKVLKWLEENVKDRVVKKGEKEQCTKGWAIGTDSYNERSQISFSFFFERRSDALNFIKQWSTFAKPETDFNYFKDTRHKLDKKTMKMKKVKSFDEEL